MTSAIDLFGHSISALLLVGGLFLILAEAAIPGAHFIILGVALFGTGLITTIFPTIGASIPLIVVVFCLVSIATYLAYSRLNIYGGDGGATGTSDSTDLVGKTGTAVETVTPNNGRVELDVTGFTDKYEARTAKGEIEPDTEIIVTDGRGGSVVEVAPNETINDESPASDTDNTNDENEETA